MPTYIMYYLTYLIPQPKTNCVLYSFYILVCGSLGFEAGHGLHALFIDREHRPQTPHLLFTTR